MSVDTEDQMMRSNGELRCDITRDTFNPKEHFVRVLAQQGRVWLDADWNEQTAILLRYIRSLARDIIGDYGGSTTGFFLKGNGKDFSIGAGHYYVDGILCENDIDQAYSNQADYPLPRDKTLDRLANNQNPSTFLAYLDVWERHIAPIQFSDKFNSFHEVALGAADTATRSRLIWQVKLILLDARLIDLNIKCDKLKVVWAAVRERLWPKGGLLKAKVIPAEITSTCPPLSEMNSSSNQGNYLYRVEVHHGGQGLDIDHEQNDKKSAFATFKWSRMNSSIAFRITKTVEINDGNIQQESTVNLESLQCCDSSCLTPGDWVEVVDDEYTLQNRYEPLWQVKSVDKSALTVDIMREIDKDPSLANYNAVGSDISNHPILRRWDQKEIKRTEDSSIGELQYGAVIIAVSEDDKKAWIPLENGIQVKFKKCKINGNNCDSFYQTGDYWLIPARTITNGIEWPQKNGLEEWEPPHGIEHHYAPLAIVNLEPSGNVSSITDTRYIISEISQCKPS